MSRFDGRQDAPQHDGEEPANHFGCCAHGCPLPGVFSDGLLGGGPYKCYLHNQVDSELWQVVTHEIRKRQWIFALMAAVAREVAEYKTTWSSRASNALNEGGRPDLVPQASEASRKYLERMRSSMRNECIPKDVVARAEASGSRNELSSAWHAVKKLMPKPYLVEEVEI